MTTVDTAPPPSPSTARVRPPLWARGDLNAFFGLGFNVLVNVLVLTSLCLFVVQIPEADVLGSILPALGIALIFGNLF